MSKIYSLSVGVTVFNYNSAPLNTPEAIHGFLAPYIREIFCKHFPESQGDKINHWNYDINFYLPLSNFGILDTHHLEFRDRITGEIADRAKYRDICNSCKGGWKNGVLTAHPDYDREMLEDGMEQAKFEYFPQTGLLIGFTLLEGLVKQGSETFSPEKNAEKNEPKSGLATLYIRMDIDKLSGNYVASAYRILFTSVNPKLLVGSILSAGDSSQTLNGNENVCAIGITADVMQLNEIRNQLSVQTAFIAAADKYRFALVPGMGNEPLVIDGNFSSAGMRSDNGGFAKIVWDSLLKEGKVTVPGFGLA